MLGKLENVIIATKSLFITTLGIVLLIGSILIVGYFCGQVSYKGEVWVWGEPFTILERLELLVPISAFLILLWLFVKKILSFIKP